MDKSMKNFVIFAGVLIVLLAVLTQITPVNANRLLSLLNPIELDPAPKTVKFYALPSDGSVSAYPSGLNLNLNKSGSGCTIETWDLAHQLLTGFPNAMPAASDFTRSGCSSNNQTPQITRGFLAFDTSSLPDNAYIISARLGLYVTSVTNTRDDGNDFVAIVEGRQLSTNTLNANDFPLAGSSVTNPLEGSARQDLSSVTPSSYLYLSLNSRGLTWIAKNNFTKLALREGHDILDVWPNYGQRESNGLTVAMSEKEGTTQDPVLEVTYIVDTLSPTVSIVGLSGGGTVSGVIPLSALVFDNGSGAASVQFKLDNTNLNGPDIAFPYSLSFNTATIADGSHALSAIAYDQAGNQGLAKTVNIVINNVTNNNMLTARPNIVLVVTDDQRWDTMAYLPQVTNLLGAESVKFTNSFVTTPVCCPSRVSILTGQYGHNSGVPNSGALLNLDETTTLPNWLRAIGYRTGLYGKYTENYNIALAPHVPAGWDEWHALEQQLYYNYRLVENGEYVQYGDAPEDYSTTVIFNQAKDFIRSTPSDKQFFLYVTPFGPHSPGVPAPQDIGTFSTFPNWRPPSYNETDVSDKPDWVKGLSLFTAQDMVDADAFHRSQLEALQSIDRGVAELVNELKATNRWGNTIFIFTSDNGLSWGEHRWLDNKRCAYDECVRVPLWVRVPWAVGRTDDRLVANIDLAPTIAARTGAMPTRLFDGLNLLPFLANHDIPWRDSLLLEVKNPPPFSSTINFQAVRTPAYLYTSYEDGEKELYDLTVDSYQMSNVVNDPAYASVASSFQAQLDQSH